MIKALSQMQIEQKAEQFASMKCDFKAPIPSYMPVLKKPLQNIVETPTVSQATHRNCNYGDEDNAQILARFEQKMKDKRIIKAPIQDQ